MPTEEVKNYLVQKLRENNSFWSYNVSSIKDVPDDMLVELVIKELETIGTVEETDVVGLDLVNY